ncbi:MAG: lipase family protein [Spirochaetota bacterium]
MAVEYVSTAHPGYLEIKVLGSNDVQDWVRNFQTFRSLAHGARANRVDRKEALEVIRELRRTIDAFDIITIEGHSRGGAIAQQIAFEIANRGIRHGRRSPRLLLFVYGSKRTGDRGFVRFLTTFAHCQCYRNRGDWIPLLPPWYASVPTTVEGRWQPVWIAHANYSYARHVECVRAQQCAARNTQKSDRRSPR